ncbi:3-oxoacyl-ACP synthase III family protein [Runella slithyformis]|uniref:Beta-ketoacyl-acyl-carrier-protein synthase III n=1 Tax=Runella slithyformis (strain ATCC 29530 / DSM 19594 / LMG 11500 / NCIMB 11436 / LSU 4) TaxID=761193 RepID=A0A7U3ZI74_RUNSL|nr:ketoacyl-ACP synthase III [Runella slithyformis]AEI47701.1 Beta-ketoacyl-acyl-carrier-protein synthase III [Runella slithyformis DSM 19594]
MKIQIQSIEKYLPGTAVHSEELESRMGIAKGWIEKNAGVQIRYWANADETVAAMAATALQKALTSAGLTAENLDMMIYAGASYDYPIPHNAGRIKKALETTAKFPCFDVDSTCLSFLNALDIAHLYFQRDTLRTIAIVSAELSSRALNPNDPKTYGLLGDAAVAVILTQNKEGYEPLAPYFINNPEGADLAWIPTGGSVSRGMVHDTPEESFYFRMDGKRLISLTLRELEPFLDRYEQLSGMTPAAYDFVIPHQTSRFGNEIFAKQYCLNERQLVNTISRYGNCISASIPLGLCDLVHQQNDLSGKKILLIGSAAGLSLGALTLKF